MALLQPWTQKLSREERAAAGLVGAAHHDEELRAGLDAAVVQPLAAVLDELTRRAADRGEPVGPERSALLRTLVQALWWERYTAFSTPLTDTEVAELVDSVLLPAVTAPGA